MNLKNTDISYSKESLEKAIHDLRKCKIEDHRNFSGGLKGVIGNVTITYGKLPSGRCVYLSSWVYYGNYGMVFY